MAAPRVLVCDDSPLLRSVLRDTLTEGGLDVVGVARDGTELVDAVQKHQPDVVTLDVEMPGLNGLDALRALMTVRPTPVIMVSSLTEYGAAITVEALAAGAVDAIQKPSGSGGTAGWNGIGGELVQKVIEASRVNAARLAPPGRAPGRPVSVRRSTTNRHPLVVIATSTGGPRALAALMPELPGSLGCGVLIVQHMPEGFTKGMATRLDQVAHLGVREATDGDHVRPDLALLAPGGFHLEVRKGGVVALTSDPPIGALRPRADRTLETAAEVYGRRMVVVVLTGMGNDGEAGCRAVRRAGGTILVEDESSCVVWGMPRAVEQAGLADAVFPLGAMAHAVAEATAC